MTAENGPDEAAPPPEAPHRFTTAEARQKAEFILSRAYGLFRDPVGEWEQISREQTNVPSILLGYVAPLAAIQPICNLIGTYVFGIDSYRPEFSAAVIGAVLAFVGFVALSFILGLLINAVAENFDGDRNDLAAQKVAAYSLTPFLLAGFAWLWPPLAWVSFIAFGLTAYLLYRGLTVLMKAPEDRAVSYMLSVTAATIVVFIILLALSSCVGGG